MSQAQLLLFGDFTIEVPRLVHQNPSAEPTSMMLSSDNIVVQQLMDDGNLAGSRSPHHGESRSPARSA
jgi:hypothetical protein